MKSLTRKLENIQDDIKTFVRFSRNLSKTHRSSWKELTDDHTKNNQENLSGTIGNILRICINPRNLPMISIAI